MDGTNKRPVSVLKGMVAFLRARRDMVKYFDSDEFREAAQLPAGKHLKMLMSSETGLPVPTGHCLVHTHTRGIRL